MDRTKEITIDSSLYVLGNGSRRPTSKKLWKKINEKH